MNSQSALSSSSKSPSLETLPSRQSYLRWHNGDSPQGDMNGRTGNPGPVCQLVDICLLPPPSVVMATTPPPTSPSLLPFSPVPSPPLPCLAGPLHPSLVFPPHTSCEPLMLILQST
ncbi:unnamed protein product [Pleuronectes platessa]|uniref:Uncharacterized protein n=1 Tax=Pleuronectes platessa TaxID=8262 RepID=A0A9N7TW68_PLEPL|nr:unnamed protein product [Pleuronectes platessa]